MESAFLTGEAAESVVSRFMPMGSLIQDVDESDNETPSTGWSRTDVRLVLLQLSIMFGSGVNLLDSLDALLEAAPGEKKWLIRSVTRSLERGFPLSRSLSKHPEVFPPTVIEFLRVGEETGALAQSLSRAADWMEVQEKLRKRLVSVLSYPVIVALVALIANLLVLKFCLPHLLQMMDDFRVAPPLLSRVVFGLGRLLTNSYFLVSLQVGVLSLWLLRGRILSKARVLSLTRLALTLPHLGPLLRTVAMTRVAHTLSLGLEMGVDTVRSLRLAFKTCGNPVYAQRADAAEQQIRDGGSLSDAFRREPSLFSSLFCQYIEAGEQTGRTSATCRSLAGQLEQDVEYGVLLLGAFIEPLLLALSSVFVGLLVVATFLPIQALLSGIR